MEFIDAVVHYRFMQHALLTSVMVGVFSGVIGSFIVLRGMALMGDAISHAVLPGVAISYALGFPLFYGAVLTGLLTALGIGYVQQNSRIKSDSAIGIVFSAAFALGVIMIAQAQSAKNLNNILFGNVLTVKASDMWTTLGVGAVVLLFVYMFYKELLVSSFDPTMAATYGLPTKLINYVLTGLLTLVTVASLQTVGVVLVVAMLVTPASTAYLLTNRLSTMLWLAAALGAISAVIGLYFSFVYNLTSGAVIVLVAAAFFVLALLFSPKQGVLWRRHRIRRLALVLLMAFFLGQGALPGVGAPKTPTEDRLPVVATFSIIYDIVATVGGERVAVHSMVPLGQDPHEYTPLPLDVRKASDARAIFWNGLDMELGDGWFEHLLHIAGKSLDGKDVFALADGVAPLYLTDGDRREMNPHAYLSIPLAMQYVRNARDGLIQIDPEYALLYEANAARLLDELEELHGQYVELIGRIPEARRILVTSERAFQYVAAEYGLREGYVWAIDTDEQGTPRQIMALIRFLREHDVPGLFIESNVDPRALETVSRETGIPIVGTLYSDELGSPTSSGGTLLGMLRWNLQTIYAGLTGTGP